MIAAEKSFREVIISRAAVLPDPEERRAIRLEARMSLREVAAFCGVAGPNIVWLWEKGQGPSPKFREVYARALEIMREASGG